MSESVTTHESYIRRCYDLARQAAARGDHPYGALLVSKREIILEARNTISSDRDATRHAEINLVSLASHKFTVESLANATLYTSTEPCVMCAGAIYWSGIGKVVFGCSAEALGRVAGNDFLLPCREIFARGDRPVMVIGPVLEEIGIRIHESFWQR